MVLMPCHECRKTISTKLAHLRMAAQLNNVPMKVLKGLLVALVGIISVTDLAFADEIRAQIAKRELAKLLELAEVEAQKLYLDRSLPLYERLLSEANALQWYLGPTDSWQARSVARDIDTFRDELNRAIERTREAQETEALRQQAIHAAGWPPHIEKAVLAKTVLPGMTTAQVTLAWGLPLRRLETLTARGKSEHWIYGIDQYVYFENGVVTIVQRGR